MIKNGQFKGNGNEHQHFKCSLLQSKKWWLKTFQVTVFVFLFFFLVNYLFTNIFVLQHTNLKLFTKFKLSTSHNNDLPQALMGLVCKELCECINPCSSKDQSFYNPVKKIQFVMMCCKMEGSACVIIWIENSRLGEVCFSKLETEF